MNSLMFDRNCNELKLGDKVVLIASGQEGKIVFECGAFGIGIDGCINYDKIQNTMDEIGIGNKYEGCFNDNFVTLWELYWNFNGDEEILEFVEILERGE